MPVTVHKVPAKMRGWRSLLGIWGELNDDWCSLDKNDVPYWYGERPLTGLLTAAAWKSRGMGLEESGAARGPVRKPRAGRIDSYIFLHGIWYQIEAKVTWPSNLGKKGLGYALSSLDKALDGAEEQLESATEEYWGHWSLALCYVVPELPWSGEPPPTESQLLTELRNRLTQRSILASYKPPQAQNPWTLTPKRRHYPGFVLVGRVSWRP
jgi:hypothetical protein